MGYTDWNIGLMHYGEKVRLGRKLLFQAMSPRMLPAYGPIQEREVKRLLRTMAKSPKEFIKHLRV
jgi:cytochrome P450